MQERREREGAFHEFDFERAHVAATIIEIKNRDFDDWVIIWNRAYGPDMVRRENIKYQVVPSIGRYTSNVLVDIRGRGAEAKAVIAAESQEKIDAFMKEVRSRNATAYLR